MRALGSFLLGKPWSGGQSWRRGFSAREGSGVFSTRIDAFLAARKAELVSAPVRALGSFLRDKSYTIKFYAERFSAREGSGVFSTQTSQEEDHG